MLVGKGPEDVSAWALPEDAGPSSSEGPTFKAYLTAVVKDADGKVVKVHRQWSHSPTSNFINILLPYNWYAVSGKTTTLVTTNNSSYTVSETAGSNSNPFYYPNSVSFYPTYLAMIQVGSGSQSNAFSAYSLGAPIANGSGAGQLVYGSPSVSTSPAVNGSSVSFTISQTFTNNSGGTITVTEVGVLLSVTIWVPTANSAENIGNVLTWYDVLSSSISIPNGGSVTIYYTFTVNP